MLRLSSDRAPWYVCGALSSRGWHPHVHTPSCICQHAHGLSSAITCLTCVKHRYSPELPSLCYYWLVDYLPVGPHASSPALNQATDCLIGCCWHATCPTRPPDGLADPIACPEGLEVSLNEVMPHMVRIQVAPGRDLAQGHQVRGSRTGVCTLVCTWSHAHV